MKLISWNVNGIRAVIRKGFLDFLKKEKPDILALQEIKISDKAREKESQKLGIDFPGYTEYWNSAERPGYSGTVVLIRKGEGVRHPMGCRTPINAINGIGKKEFDREGRVQTLEFDKFYFVNTYFPNANHELSRLNFKLEFNNALLKYLKKLENKKPVVICGDFNVAHEEIDLKNPKSNIGNPGFTYEEREWMDKFIKAGFIDVFRKIHKDKIEYTWWSYRFNARVRNIGWRIDYFFVSAKIFKRVKSSSILEKIMGSDHCPVEIKLDLW